MKVALTGGYGFLGQHTTRALEEHGHTVFRAHSSDYDLRNLFEVAEFMLDAEPDVVVHLAAFVGGIDFNVRWPGQMMHDNLRMGLNIIEQARRYGCPRVVLLGTACSYPATPSRIPIEEDELWNGYPAESTAPYGIAKLALFEMGRAYREQYGMGFDMLIPTNLYGPGDNFDPKTGHVIPSLIARFSVKPSSRLTLYGTGEATRDFLYVSDAANGIAEAVSTGTDGAPINLGSGVETSIGEIARYLSVRFNTRFSFDGNGPVGTERRLLDVTRAREVLGWEPQVSLADGLERTISWYQGKMGSPV
jgi:nucleoside-diphosphate-sugar epimerase